MTRPQCLYAAALALFILGLILYATEHEEIGMGTIVIAGLVGFIGWRGKV